MGEDEIGERLQTLFLGDRGAGAFLRAERQVDVLERGQRRGGSDGLCEVGREQVALLQGGEDDGATIVDLGHLFEPVADRGDLHLVEFPGGLLAVARDERHGCALGEQGRGGGDLEYLDSQLLGDAQDVLGIGGAAGGGGGRSDGLGG